jgi:hypothetical protein
VAKKKSKKIDIEGRTSGGAPHKKSKRKSIKQKHEKGWATKRKSYGGEKGDAARPYPRKRPIGHKGAWPPQDGPNHPAETGPIESEEANGN